MPCNTADIFPGQPCAQAGTQKFEDEGKEPLAAYVVLHDTRGDTRTVLHAPGRWVPPGVCASAALRANRDAGMTAREHESNSAPRLRAIHLCSSCSLPGRVCPIHPLRVGASPGAIRIPRNMSFLSNSASPQSKSCGNTAPILWAIGRRRTAAHTNFVARGTCKRREK